MKSFIYLLLFAILFSGCDELVKTKNNDAIPIYGDVNISNPNGDIPFKDITIIDKNIEDKPIAPDKKETDEEKCTNISQNELIGSAKSLNDSNDLSYSLLQNSQTILKVSKSLLESGVFTQDSYVRSILSLSQDILEMADKIGSMSDRILLMVDDIGDMSEKIIKTQKIQSANLSLTQQNIAEAQKNLNSILK